MREVLFLWVIFIFLATVSVSWASRPLATDDAGTVEQGATEMELSYDFVLDGDDGEEQAMGASFKHGLTEVLDFGIACPCEVRPQQGLGAAEVGVKFSLLREKEHIPALSIAFAYELGSPEYALNCIVTKGLRIFCIHLNLGYMAAGRVGERGVTTYSGAVEFFADEKLVLVGEIVGETDTAEDNPLEVLSGARWQASDALALDLAVGAGLGDTRARWRFTTGLTFGF
ncbi:MAG TPA: hypothetical protein EYP53_07915 [Candidatus Latescibacteria bacterium]|nr:hypothetical protein [Candidatus Latescibacterota bacterium]